MDKWLNRLLVALKKLTGKAVEAIFAIVRSAFGDSVFTCTYKGFDYFCCSGSRGIVNAKKKQQQQQKTKQNETKIGQNFNITWFF